MTVYCIPEDEQVGDHNNCPYCKLCDNLKSWVMARTVFDPAIIRVLVESTNDPRCKISKS